ncbi:MAG TPA: hypothetical protein P5531_01655 [Bacteroidales bacterium]|nr:hypothetical protein [Bacteroidales bacterium]HSA42361.1 hypothetical protein [Bacteroidales bacterium]
MKKIILIIVIIWVSFLSASAQDLELTGVIAAAKAGSLEYLQKIPVNQEPSYGFSSRAEFASITIGKPYQILTLSKEFFADTVMPDEKYIISTGEWLVPLLINGEYRILLTVCMINGQFEVVALGGAVLAKTLENFENLHHSYSESGMLLRVYQMSSDFVLVSPEGEHARIYPLNTLNLLSTEFGNNFPTDSLPKALQAIRSFVVHQ